MSRSLESQAEAIVKHLESLSVEELRVLHENLERFQTAVKITLERAEKAK